MKIVLLLHLLCLLLASANKNILVKEDTVWSSSTLETDAITLHGNVTVFPGVTLAIQGSPPDEGTTTTAIARNKATAHNIESPAKPFVIVFASESSSIQLHAGARIRLTDVSFIGQNSTNTERRMGRGIELISTSSDDYSGPNKTIVATRFYCQNLFTCINARTIAAVEVKDSSFVSHVQEGSDSPQARAWAIRGQDVRVERSSFVGNFSSPCYRAHDYRPAIHVYIYDGISLHVEESHFFTRNSIGIYSRVNAVVIDSTFRSPHAPGMGIYHRTSSDILIERCRFVGYRHSTPTSVGAAYIYARSSEVINCTFIDNHPVALHGNDYYFSVRNSYFGNNGIGIRSGYGVTGSTFVHNAVSVVMSEERDIQSAGWCQEDLLFYQNLVGIHGRVSLCETSTFLDNILAVQPKSLTITRPVNFIESALFAISYTGTTTADLTGQEIYWGSNQVEEDVRAKIRDGLNGGGPGLVFVGPPSATITAPFLHPTFPNSSHRPPSPQEELSSIVFKDGVSYSFPPLELPQLSNLELDDLPMELMSWKWTTNRTEQMPSPLGAESSQCQEDRTLVAPIIRVTVEMNTCEWLAQQDDRESLCQSPNVAELCPVTCGSCSLYYTSALYTAAKVSAGTQTTVVLPIGAMMVVGFLLQFL